MRPRTRWLTIIPALTALAFAAWWHERDVVHFTAATDPAFVARFAPPPAANSAQTRRELDELLALQARRTEAEARAAQADRKTRVDRFYGALGLGENPPSLPKLEALAEQVEDDVRIHVRAVKDHYRRLRPYKIETRLDPCIGDVRGDLSYPSGHAAFSWAMAGLLSDLVPERRAALEARAEQFARQRMVCGVHFPSDLAAGRDAARWLLEQMRRQPDFQRRSADAARELRAALGLPPAPDS